MRDQLQRAGGGNADEAEKVNKDFERAERRKTEAEESVTDLVGRMGLALAVLRLDRGIRERLRQEKLREDHENLKQGTLDKRERVLASAMPEPPESDPLLGNITAEVREKVKERILKALEAIYDPPDPDTAACYLLGHVQGQQRERVRRRLDETREFAYDRFKTSADQLREARDNYRDAKAKRDRVGEQSEKTREWAAKIEDLTGEIDKLIRRIAELGNQLKAWRADYQTISAEVGRLREELARLEPEQRRNAVADRVSRVLEELSEKLEPVTKRRLEKSVTKHFRKIADERFKDGKIRLTGEPAVKIENQEPKLLASLSGFEKRSFGIAFSLALAEITQRRVPLVIDTPLGNADSEYRPRALDALRKCKCDQVIILTHDREVTPDLVEHIENHVNQKFLIEFTSENGHSHVYPDRFF
ncbi:MAG: hypothetical protein M2R45_05458 [Verrucomicrobia subdivision 3 bacterium]|nr:hypothetical protein [Limisphaerales bacterium]